VIVSLGATPAPRPRSGPGCRARAWSGCARRWPWPSCRRWRAAGASCTARSTP